MRHSYCTLECTPKVAQGTPRALNDQHHPRSLQPRHGDDAGRRCQSPRRRRSGCYKDPRRGKLRPFGSNFDSATYSGRLGIQNKLSVPIYYAGLAQWQCSGFVNRRSGVRIPHPAPRSDKNYQAAVAAGWRAATIGTPIEWDRGERMLRSGFAHSALTAAGARIFLGVVVLLAILPRPRLFYRRCDAARQRIEM